MHQNKKHSALSTAPSCRVCLDDVDKKQVLELGCLCKDVSMHVVCARRWFAQRGEATCEVCLHSLGRDVFVTLRVGCAYANFFEAACGAVVYPATGVIPLVLTAAACWSLGPQSWAPNLHRTWNDVMTATGWFMLLACCAVVAHWVWRAERVAHRMRHKGPLMVPTSQLDFVTLATMVVFIVSACVALPLILKIND